MKKSIVLLILVCFLVACGGSTTTPTRRPAATRRPSVPNTQPTKAWYEGGTLHDATVAQWSAGSNANRLATASDWATVMTGWDTMEEARELAENLKACVDESAEVSPPEMKAPELAAACAVLMGWEPKN